MKPACRSFRSLLEEKLVGRPDAMRLSSLSWHEHLLGCVACRAMFESEETLEVLLATLPEPNLPPEIKRRVLVALARSKTADRALDRLLDQGANVHVPANLARNVLAGLEQARREQEFQSTDARFDALLGAAGEVHVPSDLARKTLARLEEGRMAASGSSDARLDALLERAAHVAVPSGLAARTLAGIAPARRTRPPFAIVRSTWLYAAAAVLVAALLAWAMWPSAMSNKSGSGSLAPPMAGEVPRSQPGGGTQPDRDARPDARRTDDHVARAPDPKMLEAFDVLENWDLLTHNDVDVLLSTVGPGDELLLEYQEEG